MVHELETYKDRYIGFIERARERKKELEADIEGLEEESCFDS